MDLLVVISTSVGGFESTCVLNAYVKKLVKSAFFSGRASGRSPDHPFGRSLERSVGWLFSRSVR